MAVIIACLIAGGAQAATECSVAAISALKVPGVTIASADTKTDDAPICDVKGTLATTGEGAPDGSARFEVRLPVQWNGKFLFIGVGGLGGNLYPSVTRADLLAATTGNYATAITDTGHTGASSADGSWALVKPGVADEAKLTDYYFRAVHQVTLATRQLVQGYFGKPPARSYFDGCSNGGRQALVEASRYPDDFDGIVAGAPFMDIKVILAGARFYQHLLTPSAYIPAALLPVVDKAMLASCDADDGVKDGLIQNPAKCALDLKSLICKPGETGACISADQVGALETYFTETRDENGHSLFPGSANTDLQGGGMNVWSVGMSAPDDLSAAEPWAKPDKRPLSWQFVDNVLKYIVERDPDFDLRKFRFDTTSLARFAERTGAGNADAPAKLAPFIAKGKKLLIFHGFSDPALAPLRTVKFYEGLAAGNSGYEKLQGNVRLFMAPDVQHCGGGPGPNSFDTLSALDQWVERGAAPNAILASHFENDSPKRPVDRTMPLCPFPAMATYKGQGEVTKAENWSCQPNRTLLKVGKAGIDAGTAPAKRE
ncbi:MAG TPA: tannase/feruloyl esterase family alpha/beta hydrolase [Alphaproteobacteria bacterium]|jgi:feruloyl esterase|nr:tannase/feruloyl esterase family alpha/beta hydrolase [Alphaproteobacteria bacterium]